MDIWKIAEAGFIIVMMVVLCRVQKEDPERARWVLANAFVWTLGIGTPFALIELLSAFGIQLFDVPWAIGPLDCMLMMAVMALFVMSGKKLFGVIEARS